MSSSSAQQGDLKNNSHKIMNEINEIISYLILYFKA